MSSEQILDNASVVLDGEVIHGHVVIRDGHIADVGTGRCNVPHTEDLDGDYLTPGLVELHTDNVERHLIPRPGVRWPTMPGILAHDAAIASAGITTVLDAIACGSDHGKEWRKDICDAVVDGIGEARAAGLLRAEHLLHLRCEVVAPDMPESFARNIDNSLVRLVSIMDHTPGARQFVDMDKFREYYKGKHGLNDAELEAVIAERREMQARYAPIHRDQVVSACRQRNITLASHDDATVEHIEEAVALGVTISEFPTTIAAAETARQRGLATVMGAPNMVRGGSHSGNVAADDLAGLGLLDVMSSDYVPISLMEATWLLNERAGFTLPEAFRVVSGNPARLLGLTDRGEIAAGKRADLARVRKADHGPVVRQVWRQGLRVI
ncbi:MAG: alpha-D-ribose 1-methylphosphonate 5-triphosphate diphosphatase [Aquisalimonadaceae bacterium]